MCRAEQAKSPIFESTVLLVYLELKGSQYTIEKPFARTQRWHVQNFFNTPNFVLNSGPKTSILDRINHLKKMLQTSSKPSWLNSRTQDASVGVLRIFLTHLSPENEGSQPETVGQERQPAGTVSDTSDNSMTRRLSSDKVTVVFAVMGNR